MSPLSSLSPPAPPAGRAPVAGHSTPKADHWIRRLLADNSFTIVLVGAVFCLLTAWNYGRSSRGGDFYQFWVVGQAVAKSSGIDIYSDGARATIGRDYYQQAITQDASPRRRAAAQGRQVLETYSTPFLYTFFHAIASGNYDRDDSTYLLLCLSCSVFAIVGVGRVLGYSAVATCAAIVVCLAWFEPIQSDLRVGNVNQLQLGLLALFLWFESRHSWHWRHLFGGIVLGAAVTFKPDLVYVIGALGASWLANRRFRKLALESGGILVAAVAAVTVSSVFFGSATAWISWLSALRGLPDTITTVSLGNYALARLILDATRVDVSTYLTVAAAGIVAATAWFGRRSSTGVPAKGEDDRRRAIGEDLCMVGLGVAIYLLSAPLVWLHYLVLTIPPALLALRPLAGIRPAVPTGEIVARRVLAVIGITFVAGDPIAVLLGLTDPRTFVILAATGVVILAGLALWDLIALKKRPSWS